MTIGYPQIHQSVVTEKGFMKTRALYSYLQMQAKQYHDDDNPQTDACGSAVFGLRDMEPFPVILHRMLGEMVKEGTEHIISWNDDGKSFTIHDPKDFADTILTRYFTNQTRYKSFQRQLNLYRFQRISHGEKKGAYSHSSFLRDSPHLSQYVRRARKPNRQDLMGKRKEKSVQDYLFSSEKLHQEILPVNFTLTHSASNDGNHIGLPHTKQGRKLKSIPPPRVLKGQDLKKAGADTSCMDGVELLTASLSRIRPIEDFECLGTTMGECSFDQGGSREQIGSQLAFPQLVAPGSFRRPSTVPSANNDQDDDLSIGSIDYDDQIMTSNLTVANHEDTFSWACRPIDGAIFP